MPEGEIDMKSRFTILMSALSASLWTTLGPATAQDAGRGSSMPVQASTTNAAPPEDAESFAKHFCELASHERALADSYRHLAAFYKNRTPPLGLDPASARELKRQYRRLAEIVMKSAQAVDDLANYHSGVAESIRNIRAEPVRPNPPFSSLGK
jgi:hypothetical protein